jgi:hypothetical protein
MEIPENCRGYGPSANESGIYEWPWNRQMITHRYVFTVRRLVAIEEHCRARRCASAGETAVSDVGDRERARVATVAGPKCGNICRCAALDEC